MLSHLLDYAYLLHEEAASLSCKPLSFSCHRQVLTGASTDDAVYRRSKTPIYFGNISEVEHLLTPLEWQVAILLVIQLLKDLLLLPGACRAKNLHVVAEHIVGGALFAFLVLKSL